MSRTLMMWLRAILLGALTTGAAFSSILIAVASPTAPTATAAPATVEAGMIAATEGLTPDLEVALDALLAEEQGEIMLELATTAIAQATPLDAPQPEATDDETLAVDPAADQPTAQPAATADVRVVAPVADSLLTEKNTSVTVQSPQGMPVEIRVNGQVLDQGDVGQTQLLPATQQIKQTWYDVSLRTGQNTITVHRPGELAPLSTTKIYAGSRPKRQADGTTGQSTPAPAIRIVDPALGAVLDTPATSVTVQAPLDEVVELRVNGRLVDAAQIGRTATNPDAQLTRQTYYGVVLNTGTNDLTVHRPGDAEPMAQVSVQLRGEPTQLRVRTLENQIPADGRSTATVQGQLLDAQKNRSNWDAVVTLHSSAGEFIGVDQNPDAPGFQVKAVDGQFTATLQSDLHAGLVRLRATSNDLEGFHQFEFSTPLRETGLLTGVVDFRLGRRGTDFFDSLRDFVPVDRDNGLQAELDVTAFGITSVGEWLITGALNSERPLNTDCNGEASLFRASGNCNETLYPVYGDNSTTEIVTPSTDNVYLRFERTSPVAGAGIDYALWGDYRTDELSRASQLFTATARDLHGFKANYNLGDLQITGVYGNNIEGFQRDTIAPDGTSGFYFLSRRLVIPGSEEIYIEWEELNRPGTVIRRERASRGPDYEIDYDRGSLLFREPVLRTDVAEDGTILVRRIVASYQFESGSNTDLYAGRLQYNFNRDHETATWLGATYLREQRGAQVFQLYGADALVSFGQDGKLIAEYARSENGLDFGQSVNGDAYRLEAAGTLFDRLDASAYFRSTDTGFSNNATTSFVPGQTRYGVELDARVTQQTHLRVSVDHEDNIGVAPQPLDQLEELLTPGINPVPGQAVDNELTTIRAGVQQTFGKADLGVDWVHRDRTDRISGRSVSSDQLSTSLRVPVTDDLNLYAYNDLNLSSETDPLYPNRTTVGADWQIHPGIAVSLGSTYFNGGQFDNDLLTTVGIKGQHTFDTDTTIRGELSVLGDYGLGGRFGIDQGVTLAPGLTMDFSYENVFNRTFTTATGPQFSQPFAVGPGASALSLTNGQSFSAGIDYTDNPDFQVGGRIEHRTSSTQGSNTVITARALGKITPDLTALFHFQQASAANQRLSDLGVTRDIKLGLAYRDIHDDTFNGLLRYEYRQNPATIPDTLLLGRGTGSEEHFLAVEGIYTPKWNWELYGKVGVRHSRTHLAQDLVGTSTVSLAQMRVTHRFDYRWDVSAEGRWVGQPSADFNEIGLNLEVGYYLNPNLRLSAGYAFGNVDDHDLGSARTADGPYVGVTLKLDNNLFKDFGFQKPAEPQQQESVVSAAPAPLRAVDLPKPGELPSVEQPSAESVATPVQAAQLPKPSELNLAKFYAEEADIKFVQVEETATDWLRLLNLPNAETDILASFRGPVLPQQSDLEAAPVSDVTDAVQFGPLGDSDWDWLELMNDLEEVL